MTAQTFETKLIPEDVLAILQAMSPGQRQQVFDFVAFLAQRQEHCEGQPAETSSRPKRSRDLDRGAVVWISDDFDDSLSDEFWFGENDPLMMTTEQIRQLNQSSENS